MPYLIIAALLACLGSGIVGYRFGADHEKAQQADKEALMQEVADAANKSAAQAIARLKVRHTTIQNEVEREIRTNTVYVDCKLPSDGLRLSNQALTGNKPAADSELPKTNPAD